jgi:hypothetical protein
MIFTSASSDSLFCIWLERVMVTNRSKSRPIVLAEKKESTTTMNISAGDSPTHTANTTAPATTAAMRECVIRFRMIMAANEDNKITRMGTDCTLSLLRWYITERLGKTRSFSK